MFSVVIYEPAYLFRGPRPVISAAPAEILYGETFSISTPQAGEIASIALIRLSSVTHSVNCEQRYIGLSIETEDATTLLATAPSNQNLALPGYYMLFILNDVGVPSVAELVRLHCVTYGDVDGSGEADLDDLLCMTEGLSGVLDCAGVVEDDLDIAPCGGNGDLNLFDLINMLDTLGGSKLCPDGCL